MHLTGNPFVDTGLAVIASLAKKDSVEDLTLEDIRNVHHDGEHLARWNAKLKCISMIFTINSVITQPSIRAPEKRILYYSKLTTAILESIDAQGIEEKCESCGNDFSLDIDKIIRTALVPIGYEEGRRYIGRDWFPLAGSIKNDAQALPSSSRPPNICAKCLFAVHYLPLGVILINGRLAIFQSTSTDLWYNLVRIIGTEIHERVSAGNYGTIGSKEGNAAAIKRLLIIMGDMKKDIEEGISLFIWKFSNSGTGPDCRIEEIPNSTLRFLQTAVKYGLRNEIMEIIKKDKNPEFSFLTCISASRDYRLLYPYKKFNGVSQKLFYLYQVLVCSVFYHDLKAASDIAQQLKLMVNPKKFEDLGKDIDDNLDKQIQVKKLIVEMVKKKIISFDACYNLFSSKQNRNRINYAGWKFIKYYMHQIDEEFFSPDEFKYSERTNESNDNNRRKKSIVYLGKLIYDSFIREKGVERFNSEVLGGFGKGYRSIRWIRNEFVKLSERCEGFDYEYWKYLFVTENGRESIYETLYFLRLLWTELIQKESSPNDIKYAIDFVKGEDKIIDTDLPPEHVESIKKIAEDYISKIGPMKFQNQILKQIRNGQKGLHWLRKKLCSMDVRFTQDYYWDLFLTDRNGNRVISVRIFQSQLILSNVYREYVFKQGNN